MENNNFQKIEDEIDFKQLFLILWNKKLLISGITTFAAIISVLYALSLPNVYTSTALLAPANSDESLGSKLGGFSSLAGMAGLSLPSGSGSKTTEAIARIKSYDFFVNEFLPNIKFENLVASKNWIESTDTIIYDENMLGNNLLNISKQEAFIVYKGILNLQDNRETSFVDINIEHVSPYIAEKWLKLIIKKINNHMREIDKTVAENSIDFLKISAQETNLTQIKEAISKLIKDQIQVLTLAEVSKDYVFKQIMSPIAPEKKSRPSRSLICIMGTMVGFFLGIALSFTLHFFNFRR